MYQLAIFDLDGTLVNSVMDLANAVNQGLQKQNLPTHPVDDFYHFVGNGVKKLCERALPDAKKATMTEPLLAEFQHYYEAHCCDCTKPYDGLYDVLDTLKANGIQLAVASNKTQVFTEKIVTHFFGADRFDVILGGSPNRPHKPSPEILLEIMTLCRVKAEHTIMIGDSDVDILTAKNAGIDSIGCSWGFRGKAELAKAGATYLADSPSNFAQFLKI